MDETPGNPVWNVIVEPPVPGEPTGEVRVRATSALQAEAIVRRHGQLVVEGHTERLGRNATTNIEQLDTAPHPLRCKKCGYHLDGLMVKNATIPCPECGFHQPVIAYMADPLLTLSEQANGVRKAQRVMLSGCLLVVVVGLLLFGILSVSLIAIG